jgi:hypothetical protein
VVLATDDMAATGQRFVSARVRYAGFEADCACPPNEGSVAPTPGREIPGTMFMVASVPCRICSYRRARQQALLAAMEALRSRPNPVVVSGTALAT